MTDVIDKTLPFEVRRDIAQRRIREILAEADVELVAILSRSPSYLSAQLLYIDLQNDKMLADFGLVRTPASPETDKTVN